MFIGIRLNDGPNQVLYLDWDGSSTALDPRYDLWNHSPSGFEWGYGGSGPAQLSLAMLAQVTGDDSFAIRMHQDFKAEIVSKIKERCWAVTDDVLLRWCVMKAEEMLADVVDLREVDKEDPNG